MSRCQSRAPDRRVYFSCYRGQGPRYIAADHDVCIANGGGQGLAFPVRGNEFEPLRGVLAHLFVGMLQ
jgi:hypothetical protein